MKTEAYYNQGLTIFSPFLTKPLFNNNHDLQMETFFQLPNYLTQSSLFLNWRFNSYVIMSPDAFFLFSNVIIYLIPFSLTSI